MSITIRTGLVLAVSLSLAACASLGIELPGGEDEPAHPDYETFDPTGYEASPAESQDEEHDVPAKLMAGRVEVPNTPRQESQEPETPPTSPETREVDGFRIQVFSTTDRRNAERVQNEAVSWWEGAFGESPSTTIAYIEPYYRVRLGTYASEREAENALGTVRRQYSDAFTVPDRVTVRN